MKTEKEQEEDFYDDFMKTQTKIGVSVRHRLIHKTLKKMD